jgi:polar amino acid transport system substrate-binding protein
VEGAVISRNNGVLEYSLQSKTMQSLKHTFAGHPWMLALLAACWCLLQWPTHAVAQTPAQTSAQAPATTETPAANTCLKLVATGNPEYAPYLWRNQDNLVGANADLMQQLSKEIGIPIEVKYLGPWSRVQELARTGRVDLVAGAFLTQARLDYMDYFQPAFQSTRTVIWMHAPRSFNYNAWADLRSRKGLTVVNNSFGEGFDAYAKKSLTIDAVPSLEQALQMLTLGRANYVIYEEEPVRAMAATLNLLSLKAASVAVSAEDLYLTMSHKSPCNTGEIRGRITKAIQSLTKNKTMKQLVDNNIQLWRKQNQ